jgi:hypothetical protein
LDGTELMGESESERVAELERQVASLEKANKELWRTNQRLGRERLSAQDSAAASIATKLGSAETEIERMERSLSWRLTAPLRLPRELARWLAKRIRPKLRSLALRFFR